MATTPDRGPSLEGNALWGQWFLKGASRLASEWLRAAHRIVCSLRGLSLLMVALFSVAYFAATRDLAALKPLAFDELTTYNIGRRPTVAEVWSAWFESGDGVPPVAHFATHFVGSAVGFSQVSARVPNMVGFWLMCVCIFVYLRRRVCPLLAWVGMLLPVTVPLAYSYATEMRGYGLVLGFAGAAVVCWDLADTPRWRHLALLGLPIALGAAIATHLYAVLVPLPLALAELARSIERRRVDGWVWLGLAAAGLVLLPANPVIPRIRGLHEVAMRSHSASLSELVELWSQFFSVSATCFGLFALACLFRDQAPIAEAPASPTVREGRPAAADWVLALGLMALPAVGWLFANLVTGLVLFRYVIAAVIGFSLVIPLLWRVAATRRPETALLVAAWVAVTAAGSAAAARHALRTTAFTTEHIAAGLGCFRLLRLWERLPQDGSPIVVSDFNLFHQMHHYAPDALKHRLVFVVDPEFGGLIQPYIAYYATVFGEHMAVLDGFLRSHRSFYLYDCGAPARLPLVERLLAAGATLRDSGLAETPDVLLRRDLYRVSLAGAPQSESR